MRGVRGPGLPGNKGRLVCCSPQAPWGEWSTVPRPRAWKEMRRVLLGMVSWFYSPPVINSNKVREAP